MESTAVLIDEEAEPPPEEEDARLSLLQLYGSRPIQYSTLQRGLSLEFLAQDGELRGLPKSQSSTTGGGAHRGYIAFEQVGRIKPTAIVLGDPIASPKDSDLMLDRFVAKYPRSCFWQLSRKNALHLYRKGFYINECGVETSINICDYDLRGSGKQNLRTARNKSTRRNIRVVERKADEVSLDELARVSAEWLDRKTTQGTELRFLARPAELQHDEPYVRKFFAYERNRLVGFTFFNPLFHNGDIVGYTVDIQRTSNDCPKGLGYFMVLEAMDCFRAEPGVRTLSLGWSPLYKIQDNEHYNSPLTTLCLVVQFQLANRIYSYKGLAKNKAEYRGDEEPVYFASRRRLPLGQIYRSYKACNINPLLQAGRALRGAIVDS